MANKDFYQILGVSETAPADEIKKSYRRLAKKYHPDVNAGDKAKEAKFKELSEAYETIGDEKKRADYDLQRRSPFAGGGSPFAGGAGFPGGFPGAGGGRTRVDVRDFGDIFGAGAGGGPGGGAANRGFADMFSDLFNQQPGAGTADVPPRTMRGQDVKARFEVELPVAALGGELSVLVEGKKFSVKVPAGVTDGQLVRLPGKGRPGPRGAAAGDLLLEIHIKPHALFRRVGASTDDLEVDVPIAVDQAVLGDKVEVPTLEGKAQVSIPPGTSSGVKLRLKGKGGRHADNAERRGDLYAIIQITVPREIPPKARELISEFGKLTRRAVEK